MGIHTYYKIYLSNKLERLIKKAKVYAQNLIMGLKTTSLVGINKQILF